MADVNRGNRPLSPHVSIYRFPLNASLSILHRATGVALGASLVVIVWWFLAAATSESYFATVNGLATSWLGWLVLFVSMGSLWYHFVNGIRHLIWDTGAHFGKRRVYRSGLTGVLVAVVLIALTTILAIGG